MLLPVFMTVREMPEKAFKSLSAVGMSVFSAVFRMQTRQGGIVIPQRTSDSILCEGEHPDTGHQQPRNLIISFHKERRNAETTSEPAEYALDSVFPATADHRIFK